MLNISASVTVYKGIITYKAPVGANKKVSHNKTYIFYPSRFPSVSRLQRSPLNLHPGLPTDTCLQTFAKNPLPSPVGVVTIDSLSRQNSVFLSTSVVSQVFALWCCLKTFLWQLWLRWSHTESLALWNINECNSSATLHEMPKKNQICFFVESERERSGSLC